MDGGGHPPIRVWIIGGINDDRRYEKQSVSASEKREVACI